MNSTQSNLFSRNPITSFFVLAFALSWIIEVPLALQAHGVLGAHLSFALHYLSGFGPLLAAMVVSFAVSGRKGLDDIFACVAKWRVGAGWWLVAISPLIALVFISIAVRLAQGDTISIAQLGEIERFPPLGIASLPFWIATFGLGEEIGWRGFALPRLQRGRSALTATLILWGLWAFWHTPLFFYMYPLSVLPGLILGLLAGAIVFTWIFNSTGGSVLMTIVWHGLFNYATACNACKTSLTAAVISALVMIWAVVVIFVFKPTNLARASRFTAEHVHGNDAGRDLSTDLEQAPSMPI